MTGEELKQQIALYESADHTVHLDVKVDEDTVWLNRKQLALLFGRDIKTIGKHVGNALREELNGFQLSQNLRQLHLTVRHTKSSITTWI